MGVQTVTLSIPEPIYQRARQAAEVLQRQVEDVIVDTLATTLPVLDDAPEEMASELAAMAHLSDEALQGLANNVMAKNARNCWIICWMNKAAASWMKQDNENSRR